MQVGCSRCQLIRSRTESVRRRHLPGASPDGAVLVLCPTCAQSLGRALGGHLVRATLAGHHDGHHRLSRALEFLQ